MFLFICNLLLMAFELSAEVESLIFFYYSSLFSNNIKAQVKERSDLLLFYYTGGLINKDVSTIIIKQRSKERGELIYASDSFGQRHWTMTLQVFTPLLYHVLC
jgi:hypothetical protein